MCASTPNFEQYNKSVQYFEAGGQDLNPMVKRYRGVPEIKVLQGANEYLSRTSGMAKYQEDMKKERRARRQATLRGIGSSTVPMPQMPKAPISPSALKLCGKVKTRLRALLPQFAKERQEAEDQAAYEAAIQQAQALERVKAASKEFKINSALFNCAGLAGMNSDRTGFEKHWAKLMALLAPLESDTRVLDPQAMKQVCSNPFMHVSKLEYALETKRGGHAVWAALPSSYLQNVKALRALIGDESKVQPHYAPQVEMTDAATDAAAFSGCFDVYIYGLNNNEKEQVLPPGVRRWGSILERTNPLLSPGNVCTRHVIFITTYHTYMARHGPKKVGQWLGQEPDYKSCSATEISEYLGTIGMPSTCPYGLIGLILYLIMDELFHCLLSATPVPWRTEAFKTQLYLLHDPDLDKTAREYVMAHPSVDVYSNDAPPEAKALRATATAFGKHLPNQNQAVEQGF
ncbi:hypothetical protein GQ44DRAFT_729149 [Phaeosphaeriaceae sp. PMI808]|nr:hypothetical protein GQ44DRAFT_729149 [Phaeosphaeriaceae sp. PMI808]